MPNAYEERCAVSGLPVTKGDRVVAVLLDATPEYAMADKPGAIGIGLPFECAYDGEGWFDGIDAAYPGCANLGALANAAEQLVMPSGDASPAGDWETFSVMVRERQDREVETQMGLMVVRADVHALMLGSGTDGDMAVDARAFALSRALVGYIASVREGLRVSRRAEATMPDGVEPGRLTSQFLAWLGQNADRLGPEDNDADLADAVVAADAFERAADALGVELAPSLRLRAGVDWGRVADFQEQVAALGSRPGLAP